MLDVYFHHCAVSMNCLQLARATGFLCRDGVHPYNGELLLTERQTRRVNALMLTCGTYDAAGEFALPHRPALQEWVWAAASWPSCRTA